MTDKSAAIVKAAQSYIGTPWLDHGRTRQGLDCYGLVLNVLRDVGVDFDPNGEYSRKTPAVTMYKQMTRFADVYDLRSAQAGDILAMDWGDIKGFHLAILTIATDIDNNGRVVYAPFNKPVDEISFRWAGSRVKWAFRIR